MYPSVLVTVLAGGLLLTPAFGQGRGGGSQGGSSAGSSSTGSTGTSNTRGSNPSTQPTQPTPQPNMPAPIFISGRVLMEDGTPPPNGVVIERLCNGRPHAEGYTDSRGDFSIQLFQPNNGIMQDADEDFGSRPGMGGMQSTMPGMSGPAGTNMGQERMLMGCELRAKLAGYRSQSVNLANRRPMDPPDVGTILLHRNAQNETGSTVSAVSLAAPKDARKDFTKGEDSLKKHKPEDARKDFEKAVAAYPHYAAAWSELGKLQMAAADTEGARKSFQAAADADPKFVTPYIELALLDVRAEKWQSVADLTGKAIQLDAFDYPQALYFNAVANFYLKNQEAAEKSARETTRLDTRHQFPGALHLLGLLLAQRGDYAGATEQLRTYLKVNPGAADAASTRQQLDQIEKMGAEAKK